MKNYLAKNVDEYIAHASQSSQAKLDEMRYTIQSAVPKAEESISWGIPFYKYFGMLAGFATFTHHISFGFSDLLSEDDIKTLTKQGYKTGKKIIQIRFDQAIPKQIISKILQEKAKHNEEKKKK